jgi:riboflavin biosynthesis pyrimidine reductase
MNTASPAERDVMNGLVVLSEDDGLPSYELPEGLRRRYGGGLGFEAPLVVANFVSSLDGVVALEGVAHSSQMISGRSEADRFVMGLLRASADAVLIGAGTMRAAPGSLWTPAYIFPEAAGEFGELRRRLGRSGEPRLVVLTGRGDVDPHHPALESGALVLTTSVGAATLGGRIPRSCTVVALGGGDEIDLVEVMAAVRSEGHEIVLTEGGPTVLGGLLRAGLLDELFLTLSPILAGRSSAGGRPGLVEGVELLPSRSLSGDLLSVRTHGSHLFLRLAIPRMSSSPSE